LWRDGHEAASVSGMGGCVIAGTRSAGAGEFRQSGQNPNIFLTEGLCSGNVNRTDLSMMCRVGVRSPRVKRFAREAGFLGDRCLPQPLETQACRFHWFSLVRVEHTQGRSSQGAAGLFLSAATRQKPVWVRDRATSSAMSIRLRADNRSQALYGRRLAQGRRVAAGTMRGHCWSDCLGWVGVRSLPGPGARQPSRWPEAELSVSASEQPLRCGWRLLMDGFERSVRRWKRFRPQQLRGSARRRAGCSSLLRRLRHRAGMVRGSM
jgi:hypothetical protein